MKLPVWFRYGQVRWYAGIAIVALVALIWWDRSRIGRIKREAVAEQVSAAAAVDLAAAERVAKDASDTLYLVQTRTDTVVRIVRTAATNYSTERARVNVTAPQTAGTPPGMVLVPVSFVATADSLLSAMRELIEMQAREREAAAQRIAAADSINRIQETVITALRVELKNKGGGLGGKLRYAAIGAGVAATTVAVLLGRR